MTTSSSSWLDASSLPAAQHHYHHNLVATLGIVACLSAAVGAMVTARIMRGRGGNGNENNRTSFTRRNEQDVTDVRRKKRSVLQNQSNGSQGEDTSSSSLCDQAVSTARPVEEECPSAMECLDSTATDTTAYTTPTTTFSQSCNEEHSSQSEKQHVTTVNFMAPQSNQVVGLQQRQEDDGDDNVSYPCCECSCSACSSCSTKAGRAKTGDTFCPEEVLLLPPHSHQRRRRRYTQNRQSSLTSESAFGGEDSINIINNITTTTTTSSSSNNNNNNHNHSSSEESMTVIDGGDIHLDYAPRATTHASKKSQHHAKKVKMYITETELKFKGEEEFDDLIVSAATEYDSLHLLQRTRAVSALANRLMAAPDEVNCLEEATRLMILMFDLEKVTFAMLTGSDHFYMKRIIAKPRQDEIGSSSMPSSSSDFDLECLDSDDKRPLEGTAAGICTKTLKEHYTPQTRDSPFATHRVFYQTGYNTVLVTPILVNGNKCAGCILLSKRAEDAFKKSERVIISDIGLLLGANIYAKRLLKEADESKKRSREMLHSFIPPKVLQKIECYWDSNSEEYKQSRQHSRNDSSYSSTSTPPSDSDKTELRTNSWYVAQTEWPEPKHHDETTGKSGKSKKGRGVEKRIEFLRKLNSGNSDGEDETMGVIVKRSETELLPSTKALYAEAVKDVCIIFTDIVGFSTMSMHLSPISIMDMLQNLYSRFDELCDVHGVLKLETIGDAYICATNLMEDQDSVGVRNAAIRALAMAKDMVLEAVNTQIPRFSDESNGDSAVLWSQFETLEIRVGIHVGDVMCGVLGQRLPKFTTCGKAVNMAARMEQTSQSNRIRVTKDFHDLVGDAETGWFDKEVISLKNMGDMETYLLDPLELRIKEQ